MHVNVDPFLVVQINTPKIILQAEDSLYAPLSCPTVTKASCYQGAHAILSAVKAYIYQGAHACIFEPRATIDVVLCSGSPSFLRGQCSNQCKSNAGGGLHH